MFTGIIQSVGSIKSIEKKGIDASVVVNTGSMSLDDVALGDSIAVNGVCLTVIKLFDQGFEADVSGETFSCTTFSALKAGTCVNLEKAMTPTSRLGGHIVSGHVDGIGEIISRQSEGRSDRFLIQAPDSLAKYIAAKGSVCIDGISLTVNHVDGAKFDLNIVPHTLERTTLGDYGVGKKINLEIDVIARYLERLMLGDKAAIEENALSLDMLAKNGFI